ncbi:hypothetical protein G5C51_27950, partial [Streptomyces sp. A7024]|nr:hypothetical protein [Streptomyces coryli]
MTRTSAVLLRTAGFPVRLWCAAGSPYLFQLLRELDDVEREFARSAGRAAEVIGRELIPHPGLSVAERRWALDQRRRLHRGYVPGAAEHARLTELARRCGGAAGGGAVAGLAETGKLGEAVGELRALAGVRHKAELAWLGTAGRQLLAGHPVGRRALADGTFPAAEGGLPGGGEGAARERRRADYLWRMIARGSAKVTPRGWLGHVAALDAAEPGGAVRREMALTDEVATYWAENEHRAGAGGASS